MYLFSIKVNDLNEKNASVNPAPSCHQETKNMDVLEKEFPLIAMEKKHVSISGKYPFNSIKQDCPTSSLSIAAAIYKIT